MEDKLKYLYALQQVDLKIDELEELKGDLPAVIEQLDDKVTQLQTKLNELEELLKNNILKSDQADVEVISLTEKIDKYSKQQYEVKSNKQYDALTREIENAEKHIEQLTKDIEVYEGIIKNTKEEIETVKVELEKASKELEENREELEIISKENEEEELRYQHEREKLVVRIEKQYLLQYERIRKAKNGKAVVAIKRNACGGCYNSVPAQKLVEIRQNEKFFTCEHCGRILVSDKIVESIANLP